jgi:hypothetical protein
MSRRLLAILSVVMIATTIYATDKPETSGVATPAHTTVAIKGLNLRPTIEGFARPTVATDCKDCTERCSGKIDDCKKGGQKACYLAAACLCQCNLDEGGCGSSKDALKKCVEDNEKAAKELE